MSKNNESEQGNIDYEEQCQVLIMNLLHDLRQQYVNREALPLPMANAHFTQGIKLLRATITALKLGPNWRKMKTLRKQLDELQAELGSKAGAKQ